MWPRFTNSITHSGPFHITNSIMNYCPQHRTRGYTAPKSLSLAGAHALLWQEMGDVVLAGKLSQISENSATPKSSKSDRFSTDTYGFGDPPVLRPLICWWPNSIFSCNKFSILMGLLSHIASGSGPTCALF